jgi:(E)-4-hydroxy-3-methylbut-2-enyl-diphosphate synthase
MINRIKTKQIFIGDVPIGGDAPISVQSMTFSKTENIKETIQQITNLQFAGANIVRVAVPDKKAALALKEIKKNTSMPLVADIHFKHTLALIASKVVDCIRINPGNIGSKDRVRDVVKACKDNNIPIRIGVNGGSLEKSIEAKYGHTSNAMCQSALYNIKLLEDLDFTNLKVSLKASNVNQTVEAYKLLRPLVEYPFHLGVTEAGVKFHSTIKSSVAFGHLLSLGIGDTMRVSMTGELEEEIKVAKAILSSLGLIKEGINIISCPTCGRIESDLVSAIKEIEPRISHIKKSLDVSVMGCAVNAIGEGKHSDIAIAFGKKNGLIMVKGKIVAKLPEDKLVDRFISEIENF